MLNLIKKDILIVKKMTSIILGLTFIIPMFFNFVAEEVALPFALANTSMTMILGIMLFASIYEEEEKFPKSKSLITTIGYSRQIQILERYILAIVVFVFITLVVTLESTVLPNLNTISVKGLAISFFVFSVIYGLFFSLTTKYGIRAGRYINMFIILLVSLGPVIVQKLNVDLSKIKNINGTALIIFCFSIGALFYLGTYFVSCKAYESKDL